MSLKSIPVSRETNVHIVQYTNHMVISHNKMTAWFHFLHMLIKPMNQTIISAYKNIKEPSVYHA